LNPAKIIRACCSLIVASTFAIYANANGTASLQVQVDELRNTIGLVQVAIYNRDGTIPDEKYQNHFRVQTGKIINNSVTITFDNLPHGIYAINIMHDENTNGQVDKGYILPKEGISFSNYSQINLTNRPNFKDASFDFSGDMIKNVTVVYF
jgi:uncharacterized protein (DUF2141 family)